MKRIAPVVLLVSLLAGASGAGSVSTATEETWQVTLNITSSPSMGSASMIFGVKESATAGFDAAFDDVAPPAPIERIWAHFSYPGNTPLEATKLRTSYIPPVNLLTWPLKVGYIKAGPATGNVTITWNSTDIATIPDEYISILLRNSNDTATLADMKTVNSYAYSVNVLEDIPSATTSFLVKMNKTIEVCPGDADGDGNINATDITKTERVIAGLDSPTDSTDANQDGVINALDITMVERIIAGLDAFQKGIVFTDWRSFDSQYYGLYTPPGADESLSKVAATGANWIMLIVNGGQETIASTTVFRHPHATATDAELRHVIDLAHSLGMKVMLRPQVRLSNDPSHWWGDIGTAFTTELQWQEWFASYRAFVNYYATFAQGAGVDMFVIGDELRGTASREQEWRRVVQEVRQQFHRPLTYSSVPSNGETEVITWWDAVDYIGLDFYYPLTDKNDPTLAELKAVWVDRGYIAQLENLSSRLNKSIIFTEIGYFSQDGTNMHPASNLNTSLDLQEQADCYQAALEVLWGKPWLKGIFWWQWRAQPLLGGPNDKNVYPNGKPAEDILKRFYLSK